MGVQGVSGPEPPTGARRRSEASRPRVLIVVASRHGGTTDIAGALAQQFVEHGLSATVADVDHVQVAVDRFDAVVVGSGVYLGRWLRPARRFIERRSAELTHTNVWLFSSGPLGADHGPGVEGDHEDWLLARSGAHGHREFGGRLDPTALGPVERLIARAVHAPEGDFREFQEVRDWAADIAEVVSSARPVAH